MRLVRTTSVPPPGKPSHQEVPELLPVGVEGLAFGQNTQGQRTQRLCQPAGRRGDQAYQLQPGKLESHVVVGRRLRLTPPAQPNSELARQIQEARLIEQPNAQCQGSSVSPLQGRCHRGPAPLMLLQEAEGLLGH